MTKPRIQRLPFSLLFFEREYLSYYEGHLTQRKHSDLVNCISEFLYEAKVFLFQKSKRMFLLSNSKNISQ